MTGSPSPLPGSPGRLVAVEGIDGSGKSTLVAALTRQVEEIGAPVLVVSRYLVPELSRLWRRLLDRDAVDQHEAAMLAVADHHLGVETVVRPALERGVTVVADRFVCSHLVHFSLRGVPPEALRRKMAHLLVPTTTLHLDLPAESALDRLRGKGKPDLWEAGLDYRLGLSPGGADARHRRQPLPRAEIERSFLTYQEEARSWFERVLPPDAIHLDARLPAAEVAARAWTFVEPVVPR